MSSEYILTLDAGTGGGRAVLFDLDGRQVSSANREWLPKTIPGCPGSQVFDTTAAWETLVSCIKAVIAESKIRSTRIIGVSASSMREGMVLYDRNRTEIWACPNVDARASQEVVELLELGIAEKLFYTGGDWLAITSPARFRWIQKHQPEILEQAAHVNMISDWILFKLSGEIVTDPTVGSSSGLFDLSQRTWSSSSVSVCALPRDIFPRVFEAATVIGEVTKAAALETGLEQGTPVVTAGADTQMALLGMGSGSEGDWGLVGGTFWQLAVICNQPVIDPKVRLRTLCHAVPQEWMLEGIGFLIGQQTRWFRDGFCQAETQLAYQTGKDPYHLMEDLAATMPVGANGVLALFSDVHNAKAWKHPSPSFLNFDIYHPAESGKAACIRALWESAAYVTYGHFMILREILGRQPDYITFSGGASKGLLWPQIISDVLGLEVRIPVVKETACLGAAMCVAVATNRSKNLRELPSKWVQVERVLQPNIKNHEKYQVPFARWKSIMSEAMKLVGADLLTAMWRAPGA